MMKNISKIIPLILFLLVCVVLVKGGFYYTWNDYLYNYDTVQDFSYITDSFNFSDFNWSADNNASGRVAIDFRSSYGTPNESDYMLYLNSNVWWEAGGNISAPYYFGSGAFLDDLNVSGAGTFENVTTNNIISKDGIDINIHDNLDFEGNNITDIDTITGRTGNPLRIGSGCVSTHSLTSPNDQLVCGKAEFDGTVYFDGATTFDELVRINDNNELRFGTSDDVRLDWSTVQALSHTLFLGLGDVSKSIIFSLSANRGKDHDHGNFDDPTQVMHSKTNPDQNNKEFGTWSYSSSDNTSQLDTGVGEVKILSDAISHQDHNVEGDFSTGDTDGLELFVTEVNGTNVIFDSPQGLDFLFTGANSIFNGNVTPASNDTYSLGSPDKLWKDLYVSSGSIYLGGIELTEEDGCLRTSDFHAHGTGSVAGYYKMQQGTTPSAEAEADHSTLWVDSSEDLYLQDDTGSDKQISVMDANNSLSVKRSIIPDTSTDRATINFGAGGSLIGATADTDALFLANAYYNSGYKYLTTDLASAIKLDNGEITLSTAISGTVDTAISWKDVIKIAVGKVFINENSNAKMAEGLTINQGANDDEAFALKSSDVSHSMTNLAESDTYFSLRKLDATSGGTNIRGLSDGDHPGLVFQGIIGSADPSDSTPAIRLQGINYNGDTGASALADNKIVLAVINGGASFDILGDGRIHSSNLEGTYGGGSAFVCVYDNGTIFSNEGVCP